MLQMIKIDLKKCEVNKKENLHKAYIDYCCKIEDQNFSFGRKIVNVYFEMINDFIKGTNKINGN